MEKSEMSPMNILAKCFKKEGQSLMEFKAECDEVKKHANYAKFVQECADFLGVTVKAA
jgi:hypothetical protein